VSGVSGMEEEEESEVVEEIIRSFGRVGIGGGEGFVCEGGDGTLMSLNYGCLTAI
jgi:hypothetical protein